MNTKEVVWAWKVEEDFLLPSFCKERADRLILKALENNLGQWDGDPVSCSRSQLQRLIKKENVTVRNKPIKAHCHLHAGDIVWIHFPKAVSMPILSEDQPLEVLYEDPHLIVVNKPQGLVVHPSLTHTQGTLVHVLLHKIHDLNGIGGILRPGIVHRLDKDTSGALVVAKTDRAHRAMVDIFSKHEIERVYWALCYGSIPQGEVRVESWIGRNPKDRKKMASVKKGGRKAISHFKKREEYSLPSRSPFACCLEARLETGRTHQIRVHLAGLGYSILGDPIYGKPTEKQAKWLALPKCIREEVRKLPGQALHARVLGFRHPITHEPLRFEAAIPEVFKALLEMLHGYRVHLVLKSLTVGVTHLTLK